MLIIDENEPSKPSSKSWPGFILIAFWKVSILLHPIGYSLIVGQSELSILGSLKKENLKTENYFKIAS